MFGIQNRTDINRMIELLNKKLKDITIISAVNSKETTDFDTGIKHTISEKTHIGGRCFKNEDGIYSVVALGYSPYTELNAASIHNINHELWHLFSNIAPSLYYDDNELIHDTGDAYEKVHGCGIITANITCNNGERMKANDFLYGMVFNYDNNKTICDNNIHIDTIAILTYINMKYLLNDEQKNY